MNVSPLSPVGLKYKGTTFPIPSDFEPSLFHASDALCTPVNATTCRNVVMGFGKDLAAGWGKTKETIGCRKLKKNEKGVLKSYTPLTSSHDDVAQNKNYTEIKLTV
jgi:hypothetical protein